MTSRSSRSPETFAGLKSLTEFDRSRIAALASRRSMKEAEVVAEALSSWMKAQEEEIWWEERRKNADIARALTILENAGTEAPRLGDELPRNLDRESA